MTDRPTPHPASDRALAAAIVAVGVCGLHPGDWPSSALPSWLEPQVLFALLLCASSIARIARSAKPATASMAGGLGHRRDRAHSNLGRAQKRRSICPRR
jgi:hypothetical protein